MQWIKLYVDECLQGSIRVDLEPAERSVWCDLLCLAGKSRRRGFIEYSEGIPFKKERIASTLEIPMDLLDATLAKCIKEGRITVNGDGTFQITNWDKYQDVPLDKESKSNEDSRERELRERNQTRRLAKRFPDEAADAISDKLDSEVPKRKKQ